ncbi:hypothetical protein PVAND_012666 [Polypedilum vanderplanki]|uniref:Uncharacterized protein n=1 Tax=Polypedilum vanderplanki TaxID=319348 RepID=A0A9J6CN38_POLVA|nr:hypothetical protein PVAND_012666 [Polypedilum vanderplanki]
MWSKIINFWLKVPEDKMKIIDQVFEYFCDATFMIDDIIDQGLVRRGQEPPYLKYGYPSTVACLEYVHYKMIESEEAAGELLYADDLTEGKYTFATVYAIDILKDQEVYEILMSKPRY